MSAHHEFKMAKTQVERLFLVEQQLVKAAQPFGLRLRHSPTSIQHRLEELTPEFGTAIEGNMKRLIADFATCQTKFLDPWNDSEFFRLSMRSLGVTYPADFLSHVSEGDLVEGYDMSRFQVFRNMRFMETTGYSLMEILSYEWPALFDRPAQITNTIISYCDEILWASNRTIELNVPLHLIREVRSHDPQVCEVNFKYLAPLFAGPNRPYGMLGTCRARVLEKSRVQDNVKFV
jgi:hypothetical protein